MWISKQHYQDLQQLILNKDRLNQKLIQKIKVLENDKAILLNIINPGIADLDFPNNQERRTAELDTADNMSIWDL